MATRKAYGLALAKLGSANSCVIALDGDTKNSTFAELFKQAHPERYIECYIAEQNMVSKYEAVEYSGGFKSFVMTPCFLLQVSVALGCAARNRTIVFASTFAAFFTRAFDHIRMGAISQTNINLCGSHCGVSIGMSGLIWASAIQLLCQWWL